MPDIHGTGGRRIFWWHGLIFFAAALFVQFVVIALAQIAVSMGFLGENEGEIARMLASPVSIMTQVLFTCSALACLALLAPRSFGIPALPWLKLHPAPPAIIAVSAIGMAGAGFLVDEIVFIVHSVAPGFFDSSGLDAFNRVFYNASPCAFVALTAVVVIGPGIGEELFFRGLALRSFLADLPGWLAILMSSALFGILHMNLLQGLGASLIGIYLGFAVIRTGSILPGMAAHGLNNLLCALFARYDMGDSGTIWNTGHSAQVLIAAIVVTSASIFFIVKRTPKTAV